MISPLKKLSRVKAPLSLQTILLAAIAWGVLALLFYLLFSVPIEVNGVPKRTDWYVVGTYVFELVAYLGAAILCIRNLRSPTIIGERSFWLGIGFAMLSFLLGNTILGYWELVLHQEPLVLPADLFFMGAYLFLGWSMILAISSKRVDLERWQWVFVVGIGLTSIVLAIWFSAETTDLQTPVSTSPLISLLAESVKLFYILGDIFLLIIATMLLLAYWDGRFAQSWRMIAPAVFSLYIADMWLKYAENHISNYQSGALVEVFWVFSGVLFAIGAAVEYDVSSRSRHVGGRRRA